MKFPSFKKLVLSFRKISLLFGNSDMAAVKTHYIHHDFKTSGGDSLIIRVNSSANILLDV